MVIVYSGSLLRICVMRHQSVILFKYGVCIPMAREDAMSMLEFMISLTIGTSLVLFGSQILSLSSQTIKRQQEQQSSSQQVFSQFYNDIFARSGLSYHFMTHPVDPDDSKDCITEEDGNPIKKFKRDYHGTCLFTLGEDGNPARDSNDKLIKTFEYKLKYKKGNGNGLITGSSGINLFSDHYILSETLYGESNVQTIQQGVVLLNDDSKKSLNKVHLPVSSEMKKFQIFPSQEVRYDREDLRVMDHRKFVGFFLSQLGQEEKNFYLLTSPKKSLVRWNFCKDKDCKSPSGAPQDGTFWLMWQSDPILDSTRTDLKINLRDYHDRCYVAVRPVDKLGRHFFHFFVRIKFVDSNDHTSPHPQLDTFTPAAGSDLGCARTDPDECKPLRVTVHKCQTPQPSGVIKDYFVRYKELLKDHHIRKILYTADNKLNSPSRKRPELLDYGKTKIKKILNSEIYMNLVKGQDEKSLNSKNNLTLIPVEFYKFSMESAGQAKCKNDSSQTYPTKNLVVESDKSGKQVMLWGLDKDNDLVIFARRLSTFEWSSFVYRPGQIHSNCTSGGADGDGS